MIDVIRAASPAMSETSRKPIAAEQNHAVSGKQTSAPCAELLTASELALLRQDQKDATAWIKKNWLPNLRLSGEETASLPGS